MIGNSYVVRGGENEHLRYLVFAQDAQEAWVRSGSIKNPTITKVREGISLLDHNDLEAAAVKRGWKQGSGWSRDNHDEWLAS
ncbi:hypothetical protein [Gordonia malaquae]|uniref:hypothetical protein n=1 Tax=Gordonia malaquae TaxID=410332 RepID=UPI0030184F9A